MLSSRPARRLPARAASGSSIACGAWVSQWSSSWFQELEGPSTAARRVVQWMAPLRKRWLVFRASWVSQAAQATRQEAWTRRSHSP
jgi:hypothetical protein